MFYKILLRNINMCDSNILPSDEKLSQLAFLPIVNPRLEYYYQRQKELFWTAQEIDYIGDRDQWDSLDENSKKFIKSMLFLFAQIDGIINDNLIENFKKETRELAKECSMFYAIQEAIEWGHNETYSMLIQTFIRDPEEQHKGLNAIQNYPSIKQIAIWSYTYMDSSIPLTERLIAFACVEGVIITDAFASIYWIKRKNILHALTKANEWIARDEGIHTQFAVELYHHMTLLWKSHELVSESRVHEIISSAVSVAENFINEAMNVSLIGINSEDMVQYVKCTADALAKSLGYDPIYNVLNPFLWMDVIALPNKTNFFESRVSEYARETIIEQVDYDFDDENIVF